MTKSFPQFNDLNEIEEEVLVARLKAIRKVISHGGEKGRALEGEVLKLVRSFLPAEYGLATGFIVYHARQGLKLSSQLDIIIYDAIRCGPIASLETCDVFPLEAVYGYIEVKATLQSTSDNAQKFADNSIEKCLEKSKELREMRIRKYWVQAKDSPTGANLVPFEWMPIRAYVFAFESEGTKANNSKAFAQRMADFSSQLGKLTHLHGVFIAERGYFETIPVDERTAQPNDYFNVRFRTEHTLAAFKWSLLHGLARFPRFGHDWTPAIDEYHLDNASWEEVYPNED